jgi:predicted RNA methylase
MTEKEKNLNQYFTPPGPVALAYNYLQGECAPHFGTHSIIMEPCVGDGGIAKVFAAYGHKVLTNDVDPELGADLTTDFLKEPSETYTDELGGYPHWVITNPPFTIRIDGELKKASDFVKRALSIASKGVAFLVRSSFLEPCNDRKRLLKECPPSDILVLPRISFTQDGKTDSANYHWLIWRRRSGTEYIDEVKNVEWFDRDDVAHFKNKIDLKLVE